MAIPIQLSAVADFTAGPPNPPGTQVALTSGVEIRGFTTKRGRQYELGFVEAGSLNLDIVDPNEYLNPVNSSSPWNSGGNSLLPYRSVRVGAWWNPTTKSLVGNMLNANNLVLGSLTQHYDPSFESGIGGLFNVAGSATIVTSATQHFDGAQSASVTYTALTDVVELALPGSLIPGQTYTVSIYVFVPASHTVTASYLNYAGGVVGSTIASATSSTTGAWQRLVMTGAPTGPLALLQVKVASGTFTAQVFLDAVQMELGNAASTFTTTGPTFYSLFTGNIERYPLGYDTQGRRGLRPLEAVDAISALSRIAPSTSYAATILADSPAVYMPLNDAAFPQVINRYQGGFPYLGYTSVGTSGQVNFGGDTFLDGSPAVSATQQNATPLTSGNPAYITYLGTNNGVMAMNPQAFTIEAWIKVASGTPFAGAASVPSTENTNGEAAGPTSYVGWSTNAGRLTLHYSDPNGGSAPQFSIGAGSYAGWPDGQWHHVVIRFPGSSTFSSVVDGVAGGSPGLGFSPSISVPLNNLFLDVTTYFGDPQTTTAIANMALYPSALSTARAQAHYQRGIGYLGENSGARALRLLTQYWSSNVTVATGIATLSPDFYYFPDTNQPSLLQDLQDITDTENGLLWVDASGMVRVDSRQTRITGQTSAAFVFSDIPADLAGTALPYTDLAYDYDPTYVYSQAQLTNDATGNIINVVNAASQTNYGQRILSKTMHNADDFQVQQAATFYTTRYAVPAGAPGTTIPPRIETMTLNPAANPALWTAVLPMDIGTRVTVKHKTAPGTLIAGDYYVEQISHSVVLATGRWTVDLQLSPVFDPNPMFYDSGTGGYDSGQTYVQ